ncbi:MAG: 3-hydroxyacyl-CoA dehydrogenase NAD-binding domain-containing protein [Endozoicomonas sp.]
MFPLHVLYIRTLFVLFALFLCHTGWADTIVVLGYGKTGKGYAEKVYRALKPNEKLIIVDTNPERVEKAKEWSIGKTTERLFFKGSYKEITEAEWADTVFVQELITENVKEKQTLIAGVLEKLEQQGKSDVVVASNTSSMPVILLAQSLPIRRRHQVAINHIYSPHGTVSEVGFFHILEPDDLIGTEGNLLDAETRRKVALFTAITRQKVTIFNQRLNIASIHLNNNPLLP